MFGEMSKEEPVERMSPEEFADRMYAINKKYPDDPEAAHDEADDLLCECLSSLGYSAGVIEYNSIKYW